MYDAGVDALAAAPVLRAGDDDLDVLPGDAGVLEGHVDRVRRHVGPELLGELAPGVQAYSDDGDVVHCHTFLNFQPTSSSPFLLVYSTRITVWTSMPMETSSGVHAVHHADDVDALGHPHGDDRRRHPVLLLDHVRRRRRVAHVGVRVDDARGAEGDVLDVPLHALRVVAGEAAREEVVAARPAVRGDDLAVLARLGGGEQPLPEQHALLLRLCVCHLGSFGGSAARPPVR